MKGKTRKSSEELARDLLKSVKVPEEAAHDNAASFVVECRNLADALSETDPRKFSKHSTLLNRNGRNFRKALEISISIDRKSDLLAERIISLAEDKADQFIGRKKRGGARRRISRSNGEGFSSRSYDYRVTNDLLKSKDTILAEFLSKEFELEAGEAKELSVKARQTLEALVRDYKAGSTTSAQPAFALSANGEALTLPDAPPKYPYAPRMEGGIVKYLEDNWAPYIEAGLLARPDLNRIDPEAYQALRNWLRQNELPAHLYVPTVSEAIDLEIESLGGARRIKRLAAALAARDRKGPASP